MTSEQNKALTVAALNMEIHNLKRLDQLDTNNISDGYHTFGQLYEMRIAVFIALCSWYQEIMGEVFRLPVKEGWFILGIEKEPGRQITFHLPESKWEETNFATDLSESEYQYDGHTSADVLERLKKL